MNQDPLDPDKDLDGDNNFWALLKIIWITWRSRASSWRIWRISSGKNYCRYDDYFPAAEAPRLWACRITCIKKTEIFCRWSRSVINAPAPIGDRDCAREAVILYHVFCKANCFILQFNSTRNNTKTVTPRPGLEPGSKAPEASRMSTTLPRHVYLM